MPLVLPLSKAGKGGRELVGGKAYSLGRLAGAGFTVPLSLCITTEAYRQFIGNHGLTERIQLECHRKDFTDMRWEEIWDTALRIRHLFLTTPLPHDLEQEISRAVSSLFGSKPVAIRSSASDEDARATSFAGLHESFINISGSVSILDHLKMVWASLWSDAALLYRQELNLNTEKSAMAVLVQEVVNSRSSGILFTRGPDDPDQVVIEAVHGLNQALVDGLIEPDRWFVSRNNKDIRFHPADRNHYMKATGQGIGLVPLPAALRIRPPVSENEIVSLFEAGLAAEELYGAPQDIEWTYAGQELIILQSRPITTTDLDDAQDRRPWYLSLHRSLANLRELRDRIENILLPAMARDAEQFAAIDLSLMTDKELAEETERRRAINEKWTAVYWEDFIPFAHGMRMFGRLYNDSVRPDDPYEFMELLVNTPLESVNRNRMIFEMAEKVRNSPALRRQVEKRDGSDFNDEEFRKMLNSFVRRYGDFSCSLGLEEQCRSDLRTLLAVILETAKLPAGKVTHKKANRDLLVDKYLQSFPQEKRSGALEILELGRASYRLRDDDNIHLGRIELQVARALEEAHRRLEKGKRITPGEQLSAEECIRSLRNPAYKPGRQKKLSLPDKKGRNAPAKARQLVGQPAGPGIARGTARVLHQPPDLARVKQGEVLVCDAIEPNMTFVVPLAAGIVERRGGMLIHGAIIAREYGIPCVTGINDATNLIRTGDTVNVDGYLGIVTILSPGRPTS